MKISLPPSPYQWDSIQSRDLAVLKASQTPKTLQDMDSIQATAFQQTCDLETKIKTQKNVQSFGLFLMQGENQILERLDQSLETLRTHLITTTSFEKQAGLWNETQKLTQNTLSEWVLGLNTSTQGLYLFSGQATATPAIDHTVLHDVSVDPYQGSASSYQISVGDQMTHTFLNAGSDPIQKAFEAFSTILNATKPLDSSTRIQVAENLKIAHDYMFQCKTQSDQDCQIVQDMIGTGNNELAQVQDVKETLQSPSLSAEEGIIQRQSLKTLFQYKLNMRESSLDYTRMVMRSLFR